MNNRKSLKANAVLNIIKTICGIVFPLVSFPYATRVLGSVNYGTYSFSTSIISYISLIAAFGISNYAIREGARKKKNLGDLSRFTDQIFTLNILTTLISYVILFILLITWRKLDNYRYIILVLSISVLFTTIGTDWVNIVFEDYAYITKRYIACYIIQMICLFIFVKKETDIIKYATVSVITSIVANLLNIYHIRRDLNIFPKIVFDIEIVNHLKPAFVFFVSSILSTIYLNSDITILGILENDYSVGIYTVSSRIYVLVRHIINAITAVIIPRVSVLIGENKREDINELLSKAFGTVVMLTFPAVVGMIILRVPIVHLISGKDYIAATNPLLILSFALIFATIANIYINAILVPFKREKNMLYISAGSAMVNIVLNFALIPILSYNAAALTTLLAEAIVVFFGYLISREFVHISVSRELLISLVGSAIVLAVCLISQNIFHSCVLQLVVAIFASGTLYFIFLVLIKNNMIYDMFQSIYNRLKTKRK